MGDLMNIISKKLKESKTRNHIEKNKVNLKKEVDLNTSSDAMNDTNNTDEDDSDSGNSDDEDEDEEDDDEEDDDEEDSDDEGEEDNKEDNNKEDHLNVEVEDKTKSNLTLKDV